MSRPRVLCLLSADFGEYVTASLFARGQPFDVHFALPPALERFVPPGTRGHSTYRSLDEARALVAASRPELVLLASGYLYAVNRIASVEDLAAFVEGLNAQDIALATTDPWLRIWALRPGSRYTIHSLQKGGVDAELSSHMDALQGRLESLFADIPHVFAVPLRDERRGWHAFFNPVLQREDGNREEWLFVLSREDYVFAAGFGRQAFFSALERRIAEVLSRPENRVRLIAPGEVGRFLAERWPGEPRLAHLESCDFASFERLVGSARLVAYWNILSASLLYCLYRGVAPIFFGAGHLAKVCPGLEDHAVEHVYRGRRPRLLELGEPLNPDAGALIRETQVDALAAHMRKDFARSPSPAAVLEAIRQRA